MQPLVWFKLNQIKFTPCHINLHISLNHKLNVVVWASSLHEETQVPFSKIASKRCWDVSNPLTKKYLRISLISNGQDSCSSNLHAGVQARARIRVTYMPASMAKARIQVTHVPKFYCVTLVTTFPHSMCILSERSPCAHWILYNDYNQSPVISYQTEQTIISELSY